MPATIIIALGGNALSPSDTLGTITEQFAHTRGALQMVLPFIREGHNLAIVHGNGPQVGDELRRVELSSAEVPALPLGVCVAATQGSIGYMIEQSLHNALVDENIHRDVVSIITQVIVDESDSAMTHPTKFVGHKYSESEINILAEQFDWSIQEQEPGVWRRVVPSPKPLAINNARSVKRLVDTGSIVIVSGGGGIPAQRDDAGHFDGVDAVIDKDLAAALLGAEIGARDLYILTDVSEVYLNFGTEQQEPIAKMTAAEARSYLAQGQFPPGSMGPKIEAAVNFLEAGGEKVVITGIETLTAALSQDGGTVIIA